MSEGQFSKTTRRSFLGTATVATAATLAVPVGGAARNADIPSGTGLGSSGSFTTALLKALYAHRMRLIEPRSWRSWRAKSRSIGSVSRSASRTSISPHTAA